MGRVEGVSSHMLSQRPASAAIWSVMLVALRVRSSRSAETSGSSKALRYPSALFFSALLAACAAPHNLTRCSVSTNTALCNPPSTRQELARCARKGNTPELGGFAPE